MCETGRFKRSAYQMAASQVQEFVSLDGLYGLAQGAIDLFACRTGWWRKNGN